MKESILPVLALLWIGGVIIVYYQHHKYLEVLQDFWKDYLNQGLIVFAVIIGYCLYKYFFRNEKKCLVKVSVGSAILAFSVLFVAHFTYVFYRYDPAIYIGPAIIRESLTSNKVRFAREGEALPRDGRLIVMRPGSIQNNTSPLVQQIREQNSSYFRDKTSFEVMKNLALSYINSVLPILLACFLAYSLGYQIRKYLLRRKVPEAEEDGIINALTNIAIGYVIICVVSFGLALFGIFNALSVRIVAVIILIAASPSLWQIVKTIFKTRTIQFHYISAGSIAFVFVLLSSLQYILGAFHDIPIGIDGARRYTKIVYDLINWGSLPKGQMPYFTNILNAFGSLLTYSNLRAVMAMPFFHAVLSFFVLYAIGKKFFHAKSNVLFMLGASIGAMAMTLFLAVLDHKTEFFALFFGLLGIYYLLKWRYVKENALDFALAALFIGFAFVSKMTFLILLFAALVFLFSKYFGNRGVAAATAFCLSATVYADKLIIPGLAIGQQAKRAILIAGLSAFIIFLAISCFRYKKEFFSAMGKIFIFGLVAVLPFIPWAGLHYAETGGVNFDGLIMGRVPKLDSSALMAGYVCQERIETSQDYGRYISYDNDPSSLVLKYVTLPLEMTFNYLNPGSNTTDIGFLALALTPVLFILNYRRRATKILRGFLLINLIMWLFWVLMSPGVTWYGICALATLFIMLAALWPDYAQQKPWYVLAITIVLFYLGVTSNFHIKRIQPHIYTAIGAHVITDELFFDMSFPAYRRILDTLGEEKFLKNHKYVIEAGGTIEFFLRRGPEIIFEDNYLDFLSCGLDQHNGDAKAFMRELKKRGVEYVFISKYMMRDPRRAVADRYRRVYSALQPVLNDVVNHPQIYYGALPDELLEKEGSAAASAIGQVKEIGGHL